MSIIELLVTIAIILLLAGLILGAAIAVKKIVRSLGQQATTARP